GRFRHRLGDALGGALCRTYPAPGGRHGAESGGNQWKQTRAERESGPMRALAWLFSAHGFKTPFACGGWSPLLISASVVSNGVIALIFFSIPWFLLRFRRVHEPPKIFRRSQMSGWYSAIFIACGV